MQWLTPVIPALWKAEIGRSFELRTSRATWATWQNLISTKNERRLRWKGCFSWEAAVSQDAYHCTPTWATKQDSVPKEKKRKRIKINGKMCFH